MKSKKISNNGDIKYKTRKNEDLYEMWKSTRYGYTLYKKNWREGVIVNEKGETVGEGQVIGNDCIKYKGNYMFIIISDGLLRYDGVYITGQLD